MANPEEVLLCGAGVMPRGVFLECDCSNISKGGCYCDDDGSSSHRGRVHEDDDMPPSRVRR